LEYPLPHIRSFLGEKKLKCAFIPYAGVSFSFDEYTEKVSERFQETGHEIVSVHTSDDPVKIIDSSDAVIVGGGNTFNLLKMIQDQHLIEAVRKKVLDGAPYVGWSAGSNMACPTIKTTNDMPIIDTDNFHAFNLIPFQINPHYLDANPTGHAGETREARIEEFLELNRDIHVVGLREGTILELDHDKIRLIGSRNARLFKYGSKAIELGADDDFNFLLEL